jgi:hypothetical protein
MPSLHIKYLQGSNLKIIKHFTGFGDLWIPSCVIIIRRANVPKFCSPTPQLRFVSVLNNKKVVATDIILPFCALIMSACSPPWQIHFHSTLFLLRVCK